ncbi:hypothetical protein BKA70DRAFT_1224954 [Coprinopsis sp. MPI-PUGE-AT-0042]|nr:hypothetical protein BKA70DRAFT_1224954 [Coprinopsis sp. MPI-PUGE-AT-0042]
MSKETLSDPNAAHWHMKGMPATKVQETTDADDGSERAQAIGWMASALGISPYFFDSVLRLRNVTALQLPPLRASLESLVDEPDVTTMTLNGVYPIFNTGKLTTVWFSHSLSENYSLYVVNNCAQETIAGLERFLSLPYSMPLMAVDAVLLDDTRFFHTKFKEIAYGDTKRTITLLGRVSKGIKPRFVDKELVGKEMMEVTGDLLDNMEEIRRSRETTIANALEQLSTLMSFKVAVYSAQTAVDAKRDASSMTTIALVTMLFLPGSFVAAFFSTGFVKITGNDAVATPGNDAVTATPLEFLSSTWVFVAISVPLTLLVFLIWIWFHGSIYYAILRKKWVVDRIQSLAGAFEGDEIGVQPKGDEAV